VSGPVTLDVDALDAAPGIRIRDTAEGEASTLSTDGPVSLSDASTGAFDVPVDTAVEVDATELHLPSIYDPSFRRDGEVVYHGDQYGANPRLPAGTYEVDFSPPSVKLYVRVEDAAPRCVYTDDHTYLDFSDPARVLVGVRSYHVTPAGTVTVTDDPRDLMAGVSTFGSALKTLSPDRSWPTLRGHPPAFEFGAELDVPDEVPPAETDVRVEVPPAYGPIFTVAPLAFYLGASVEPGEQPRLVAGDAVREFDGDALAAEVRETLEHVFTLDCVVREAGVYQFGTEQSVAVEAAVDVDYEALFELPLAERTAAYLDVPRSATDGLLDWHYTADVAPKPENAVALPYLADELALVRSPPVDADERTLTPSPDALQDGADRELARSIPASSPTPLSVAIPEQRETPGQSWISPDLAPSAANPTVGSFRRGFDWPSGDAPLDVHVVHNDSRLEVHEEPAYDVHELAETDVRVSQSLSTTELRDALTEDVDFLHFVGHVTDAGMLCRDGALDVRTLADTGVSAFLLNGCRSYEQGRALLTAGAVGGIVTVDDVADATAGTVGRTVSMLLDAGFPLYAVLDVLRESGPSAQRYAILGSGTLAFRAAPTTMPVFSEFDPRDQEPATGDVALYCRYYPYGAFGMGSFVRPMHGDGNGFVGAAQARVEHVERDNFAGWLDRLSTPMRVDGEIRHPESLRPADFE
jgi:hypothetical protein